MTRKYVVETVIGRVDEDYKYFRRTVELDLSEEEEAKLAVGDQLLVTDAAYPVPVLCEVTAIASDRVRMKRLDDRNPYTLLLALPMK